MKNPGLIIGCVLLVSGPAVFADAILAGASSAVSTAFNPSGSFWNNSSSDTVNGSSAANVGNFLNDTGGFALNGNVVPGCSTCGVNYMAGGGQMYVNNANTPDYVSNLNFVKQAGGLQITLLYANSASNGFAEFGIYDVSNPTVNHLVLQQGQSVNLNNQIGSTYVAGTLFSGATNLGGFSLASGSPYADWGLYVTTCTEGSVSLGQCSSDGDVVTYYMGAPSQLGGNQTPYDAAHEHFALFQSGTNTNQYYAGLEDTAFTASNPDAGSNSPEGYGDYNDLIFGITSSIAGPAVPEPATLSIVGIGLAGMGLLGLRRRSGSRRA